MTLAPIPTAPERVAAPPRGRTAGTASTADSDGGAGFADLLRSTVAAERPAAAGPAQRPVGEGASATRAPAAPPVAEAGAVGGGGAPPVVEPRSPQVPVEAEVETAEPGPTTSGEPAVVPGLVAVVGTAAVVEPAVDGVPAVAVEPLVGGVPGHVPAAGAAPSPVGEPRAAAAPQQPVATVVPLVPAAAPSAGATPAATVTAAPRDRYAPVADTAAVRGADALAPRTAPMSAPVPVTGVASESSVGPVVAPSTTHVTQAVPGAPAAPAPPLTPSTVPSTAASSPAAPAAAPSTHAPTGGAAVLVTPPDGSATAATGTSTSGAAATGSSTADAGGGSAPDQRSEWSLPAQAAPAHPAGTGTEKAETAAAAASPPAGAPSSAPAPTPPSGAVAAPGATAPALPVAAPAPVTTPAAAPVVAAPLVEQLTPRLVEVPQLGPGVHRLTLEVKPEAIGSVRVVADISPDAVRIELIGGSDLAREALRSVLADLRRDLAATGSTATLDLGDGSGSPTHERGDRTPAGASPRGPAPAPAPAQGRTADAPVLPLKSPGRGVDVLA
jgi:hypothetical protein